MLELAIADGPASSVPETGSPRGPGPKDLLGRDDRSGGGPGRMAVGARKVAAPATVVETFAGGSGPRERCVGAVGDAALDRPTNPVRPWAAEAQAVPSRSKRSEGHEGVNAPAGARTRSSETSGRAGSFTAPEMRVSAGCHVCTELVDIEQFGNPNLDRLLQVGVIEDDVGRLAPQPRGRSVTGPCRHLTDSGRDGRAGGNR